jgi:hypothetical protein
VKYVTESPMPPAPSRAGKLPRMVQPERLLDSSSAHDLVL